MNQIIQDNSFSPDKIFSNDNRFLIFPAFVKGGITSNK